MILNQKFVEEINQVDQQITTEQFEKSLNYSIQYIANNDTQVKLSEILEIEEEVADEYLKVFLKLVAFFTKVKFEDKNFMIFLDMVNFSDKVRKEIFIKKIEQHQKALRNKFDLLDNDVTPSYQNIKWRYDIQVSSRTFTEEVKPKILLQLDLKQGNETEGVIMQTDYANLKHLHEELQLALKSQTSTAQNKIRKLFV